MTTRSQRREHPISGIIFFVLPLVLLLSCRTESIFNRLGEDYLPYDGVNSVWEYQVTGEDTVTIAWTIAAREVVGGREASLLESTEGNFYYTTDRDALHEFVSHTVFSFGENLVLEERWRKRIVKPLNLGNRWEDAFSGQVVQQGVTYSIESSVVGVVEDIETVFTPVDFFDECYRVSIETYHKITLPTGGVDEETVRMKEWYAPGVGMVKREVEGGERWELTEFIVF